MKILLINNYYNKSNEEFFLEIKRNLEDKNIELEICFLIDSKIAGRNWSDKPSINYIDGLGVRIWKFTFFPFWKFRGYDKYLIFEDVPVGINYIAAHILLKWKLEVIEESIICPTFSAERFYKNFISYFLLKFANNIFVTSTESDRYVKLFTKKDTLITGLPSLIEGSKQIYQNETIPLRIIHVGANYKRKGVKWTYQTLKKNCANFIYVSIGEKTSSYGSNHTNYTNLSRPEVLSHMQRSNILVLNSKDEPWGHVVPEAIKNGCIPLISNRCGAKDILSSIYPQLIFNHHSEECFKKSLKFAIDLLKNNQELKEFFERSNKALQRYSAASCAKILCSKI